MVIVGELSYIRILMLLRLGMQWSLHAYFQTSAMCGTWRDGQSCSHSQSPQWNRIKAPVNVPDDSLPNYGRESSLISRYLLDCSIHQVKQLSSQFCSKLTASWRLDQKWLSKFFFDLNWQHLGIKCLLLLASWSDAAHVADLWSEGIDFVISDVLPYLSDHFADGNSPEY